MSRRSRGVSPVLLALGGLVLLLLIIWLFSTNRSPDQDKLTGNEVAEAARDDPEARCASKATYDRIKRELFRQAAQVRGSDQAAFDRLSAYAVVRMENPVLESEDGDTGAVSCSGALSLDLPPGVAVVGGRRTLTANLDYTLRRAADGTGEVVLLRNADNIITPLATLARVSQPTAQQPAAPPSADGTLPAAPVPGVPPTSQPPQPQSAPEPELQSSAARPSFNCGAARTRGEIAVCRDTGLATLDRQMASQFYAALDDASPAQRALLQRTRGRFLAYRDACRSDGCIADAYRGRMREISDIMAGRWRPPR